MPESEPRSAKIKSDFQHFHTITSREENKIKRIKWIYFWIWRKRLTECTLKRSAHTNAETPFFVLYDLLFLYDFYVVSDKVNITRRLHVRKYMNARLRAYFRPHPLPIYVIPVAFMSSTVHVQCKEIISKDLLASFLTCTDEGLCGKYGLLAVHKFSTQSSCMIGQVREFLT